MRKVEIDCIKGLAIIAMVVGHYNFADRIDGFVNLFHMSCFLMASGYFFDYSKLGTKDGLVSHVKGKMKRLWLPWVLWTVFFLLIGDLLLKVHFYSDDPRLLEIGKWNVLYEAPSVIELLKQVGKALLLQGGTAMTGQMWFVQVLFHVSIWYGAVTFLLQRYLGMFFSSEESLTICIQTVLCVLMLALGYQAVSRWFKVIGGGRFFVCYGLFHVGVLIRRFLPTETIGKVNRRFCFLIFVIAMLLLFVLYISGVRVGLSRNHYSHAIFLLLAAFSGWFAMLCASHLMGQRICSIVAYIGRHTMPILIFQWLMFRLVNCIGCVFAGRPSYMIAAVPTAFSGFLWGVIYVSVAIGGALILNELWWRVWSRGCATVVKRMSWTQA